MPHQSSRGAVFLWLLVVILQCTCHANAGQLSKTVEIAPGVHMPRVSLGTCCGSQPRVGLEAWLRAGGRGIDTAYDYGKTVSGGLQADVRRVLEKSGLKRSELFITTKIPAGFGFLSGFCLGGAKKAIAFVKEDLKELGVKQADLVLLHAPCLLKANTQALWRGLEMALEMNLTRAIGISNFNVRQIKGLMETAKVKPSVNQCSMNVLHHNDATIAFCKQQGIQYEAYSVMRGCPFKDEKAQAIAKEHSVSVAQVCIRWTLQRGVIAAVGTGHDPAKVEQYAKSNLNVYDFSLSPEEMATLDALAGSVEFEAVVV